jgi:hypothetical protein
MDACLVNKTSVFADLEFKSGNGTLFSLVDAFETGVLNFTGRHRCSLKQSKKGHHVIKPGMIVSCMGTVCNLNGSRVASIDCSLFAVPVVGLSISKCDSSAFGVFCRIRAFGEGYI